MAAARATRDSHPVVVDAITKTEPATWRARSLFFSYQCAARNTLRSMKRDGVSRLRRIPPSRSQNRSCHRLRWWRLTDDASIAATCGISGLASDASNNCIMRVASCCSYRISRLRAARPSAHFRSMSVRCPTRRSGEFTTRQSMGTGPPISGCDSTRIC